MELPWATKLFLLVEAETLNIYPQYYMGEDEEEKYEGVDELFRYSEEMEERPPRYGPRVEITKEKYINLFRKWRGALIIKVLGKSVSYRILEQRLREIWRL